MVNGIFAIGQRFHMGASEFRFVRKVEPKRWIFEDISTGSWREEAERKLLANWTKGELTFPSIQRSDSSNVVERVCQKAAIEAFKQSYPKALLSRAQAKLLYIKRLEKFPLTEELITPLIVEIHNDKSLWKQGAVFKQPPHFTTLAQWRRAYEEAGQDIRALCDRHHEKGNAEARYPAELEAMADDIIDTAYLTEERPTIESCLEIFRGRVARANLQRLPSEQFPRPTHAYLRRRISHLPKYDVTVARYGKRLADIKFRNAGLGVLAKTPLARASIDHCRLDLMVVDDSTGLPLGRPWLTLVLDEKTRYVLGFYIGFEEPSSVSVQRAICNAITPKDTLLSECPEIQNEWDAWGVMECIVMDNGMEFHGEIVESGVGKFGITLQYCPRKKPWYKGKIERVFGTLNSGLLSTLPGKTFSNIFEKLDYNPEKHAVIGLAALRNIVMLWIVDIYHQKKHRGLGMPPAKAWGEGMSSVDRWLPPHSISLDAAFSRTIERTLTHKGLEIDSLFYNSSDMRALRELHGADDRPELTGPDVKLVYAARCRFARMVFGSMACGAGGR
jgi:putative transposase